jgi:hypothetical protein
VSERSPEQIRTMMSSFQAGLRRGRQAAGDPTAPGAGAAETEGDA